MMTTPSRHEYADVYYYDYANANPEAGYSLRVLATTPLRYNKLNEGSGTTIVDSSGNGYTGTYTAITWGSSLSPFAGAAPLWNGTTSFGNLYSAAYGTDFNLNEGFVLLWVKVTNVGVWSDATFRRLLTVLRDTNNRIAIHKTGTANNLTFLRVGNATTQTVAITATPTTNWFSIGMSWSVANNEFKAYVDGVQVGTTQTGLVSAVGSGLSSTDVVLGAQTTTPAQVWDGYLSQFVYWTAPSDAAKLALMTA